MSIWAILFMMIFTGILFTLVEVFLLPGFGITGIMGVISFLAGIGYAIYLATVTHTISTLAAVIFILGSMILAPGAIYVLGRLLKDSSLAKKFYLNETLDSDKGYTGSNDDLLLLYGEIGETSTPLTPSGSAIIKGEKVSVISEEGYMEKGRAIEVTNIEDNSVYVKSYTAENKKAESQKATVTASEAKKSNRGPSIDPNARTPKEAGAEEGRAELEV